MPTSSGPSAEGAPRRGPGRPPGGRAVVERDELVVAAERCIRERGPHATLDEIAAEAGVSKPTLYRTLGDKDALVLALSESLVDRIGQAVGATSGDGPRAMFEAAVAAYLETVATERNLFLFVNAAGHGSEQFRSLVGRSAAGMIDTFGAIRRRAGLDPSPAATWAHAVVGSFQVVMVMWLADEYCGLDEIAERLTQLLWPGVASIGSE